MSEKTESTEKKTEERAPAEKPAEKPAEEPGEKEEQYVSDQLAVKTWSVIARHLHEGDGIVELVKAWDQSNESYLVFPCYSGQDPDAIKPDIWMAWRHVLKAPLGGHTYIRDYAEVADALPIESEEALEALDPDQPYTFVEAKRRYREGEPGLVALVLRIYHLPRAYKFYNLAEVDKAGTGNTVPLPFDVALEDLVPALDDEEFELRRARVKKALGRS